MISESCSIGHGTHTFDIKGESSTELGDELLTKFIRRNILLFQDESVEKRVQAVLNGAV